MFGKKGLGSGKFNPSFPRARLLSRNPFLLITLAIFTLVGLVIIGTPLRQYNLVYEDIATYGWGYWS